MHTQTEIAKITIDQKADCVLSVKNNHLNLLENTEDEFRFSKNYNALVSTDLNHGKIETRKCSITNDFQHIENQYYWKALHTINKI